MTDHAASWLDTYSIVALDLIEAMREENSNTVFAILGRYSDPRQLRALAFSAASIAGGLDADRLAEIRELCEDA